MTITDAANKTFKRLLLNKCQEEFEREPVNHEDMEYEYVSLKNFNYGIETIKK